MSNPESKSNRMIVSLQVGGFFFALANIICVAILAWTYMHIKLEPKTLEVKGSAKRAIQSDLISWSGSLVARDADLIKAYDKLKADSDRVAAFIKSKGVPESEITFSSIQTAKIFAKDIIPQTAQAGQPAPPPLVIESHRIEEYVLTQSVTVESKNMEKVPEVSRSITSLIKDGVEIESDAPRYLYTKLAELKIDMLAEASKDATTRASQVVNNANGHLGKLVEAKMGVMQINPKGSSATSAEGINDTSSFEKEITAIVTVRFELN
jgi:uncharacterized protein